MNANVIEQEEVAANPPLLDHVISKLLNATHDTPCSLPVHGSLLIAQQLLASRQAVVHSKS